jgi:hypothetical protein
MGLLYLTLPDGVRMIDEWLWSIVGMLTGPLLLREPQMARGLPGDWSQASAVNCLRPPNSLNHSTSLTTDRDCITMEQQVLIATHMHRA